MCLTSFNEPERLQSQQRLRLLHIELGEIELEIAKRHLRRRGMATVADLRANYEQAAFRLLAAYGCFAEAGLGAMARTVLEWRQDVLRLCRRCVG